MTPIGDVYGGGSPTGNAFYENGALGAGVGRHVPGGRGRPQRGLLLPAEAIRRGLRPRPQDLPDLEQGAEVRRLRLPRRRRQRHQRGRHAVPAVGRHGRPRRRHLRHRLDRRARRRPPGSRRRRRPAPSTASRRRGSSRSRRRSTPATIDGPDHRAALAGDQRPRHRLQRPEGARRGGRRPPSPRCSTTRTASSAAARCSCSISSGRRARSAPARPTRSATRRCGSRRSAPCGAPVSMYLPAAAKLAKDKDPGVRREVALSLRDQPAEKTLDMLVELARGYDGQDRSYLEALGHRRHQEGSGTLRPPAPRAGLQRRRARRGRRPSRGSRGACTCRRRCRIC